jgi:hypothetical protein
LRRHSWSGEISYCLTLENKQTIFTSLRGNFVGKATVRSLQRAKDPRRLGVRQCLWRHKWLCKKVITPAPGRARRCREESCHRRPEENNCG